LNDDIPGIFRLRRAIARIGESDWMAWWASHAQTDAGRYTMPRLFGRTAELTAAHIGIASARVRHDASVPDEPLVHLFSLGEDFEGAFERWLIGQKASGAAPEPLPRPGEAGRISSAAALAAVGVRAGAPDGVVEGSAVSLGSVRLDTVDGGSKRARLAERLAAAYAASEPGRLVVPFFRLER
jgi:hypothetical protein